MRKVYESDENTEVVFDGNFEISVTPWLRNRFEGIRERIEEASPGEGLSRSSQREMFEACEFKEVRVVELVHYLARTKNLQAEGLHERIRMMSDLTRGLCIRIAADQSRQRKRPSGKKASVRELASSSV